jgi:hypothetical protein
VTRVLNVKPEYLTKNGKRQFVVLTVKDFNRIKAALEDARDLRDLRDATRKNAKAPYYTSAQVAQRLRTHSRRKGKAKPLI